ncbi:hypothetical protein K9M42_01595 [Patescibacteria group bacterium]|nr:hypothetical protein [Patescibacteria group bacterium]
MYDEIFDSLEEENDKEKELVEEKTIEEIEKVEGISSDEEIDYLFYSNPHIFMDLEKELSGEEINYLFDDNLTDPEEELSDEENEKLNDGDSIYDDLDDDELAVY